MIDVPDARAFFNELAVPAFDEVSFLYLFRHRKAASFYSTLDDIATIDERLRNNLSHLAMFTQAAQVLGQERYSFDDAGDAFCTSYLAFMTDNKTWLQEIFNAYLRFDAATDFDEVFANESGAQGIATALAWMPDQLCLPWLKRFLNSTLLEHKWLAVRVCALKAQYPKDAVIEMLKREDCRQHTQLFQALIALVGVMRDKSLLPVLIEAQKLAPPSLSGTFYRARLLLGDSLCHNQAIQCSLESNDTCYALAPLLLRTLSHAHARSYLSSAIGQSHLAQDLKMFMCAEFGDPQVLSWLIEQLHDEHCARWVGLSISQITGASIVGEGLEASDKVADTEITEQSDELKDNEDAYFLQDATLPLPDKTKLATYLHHQCGHLKKGQRYLFGNLIDRNSMDWLQVLTAASRSTLIGQREAARRELLLIKVGSPDQQFLAPQKNSKDQS